MNVKEWTTSELIQCIARLEYGHGLAADELNRRFPVQAEEKPAHGWQPIETAPRDGTRILLTRRLAHQPEVGAWDGAFGLWRRDDACRLIDHHAPTHWHPLPEVPR